MPSQDQLLKRAMSFSQSGDLLTARRVLLGILKEDETHQAAWIYYASTFSGAADQAAVLRKALDHHPRLGEVRRALLRLEPQARTYQSTAEAAFGSPVIAPREESRAAAPRAASRTTRPAARSDGPSLVYTLLTLLVILALFASTVYFSNQLWARTGQLTRLQQEKDTLQTSHLTALKNLRQMESDLRAEQGRYGALSGQYGILQTQFGDLTRQHQALQQQHQALSETYNTLTQQKQDLQNQYDTLWIDYDDLNRKAVVPPFITVWQRQVTVAFYRKDQSIRYWTVPFDMLENQIQNGSDSRKDMYSNDMIRLKDHDGTFYNMIDFRNYVDPSPFTQLIPEMYREAGSDAAFLEEVWYMVSQLTYYSTDQEFETPRYPLETLLAGGGDCEDTAILFASMVKAAPVPWTVSLGYINAEQPYESAKPNHVMVVVDTGPTTYYIETTSDTTMNPYTEAVYGWFLDLE